MNRYLAFAVFSMWLPLWFGCSTNPPVADVPDSQPVADSQQVDDSIDCDDGIGEVVQEPNDAVEITFDDLALPIEPGDKFHDELLTSRAKELLDQRIRLEGVMYPADKLNEIESFVLLRSYRMGYAQQPADEMISVKLRAGSLATFRNKAITIEGVLRLSPFDGPNGATWSIYDLEDAIDVTPSEEQAD